MRLPIRPIVAILWFLTSIPAAVGYSDQPPRIEGELTDQVEALVMQLADDDPRVREDAERKLHELGARALPFLPESTSRLPVDLELRITRIRKHLERQEAESVIHPSRVTLQGEFTLAEALRAIESQTGNRIRDARVGQADDTQIPLDFQDVPYWQAVEHLLRATGTHLNAYSGTPHSLTLDSSPMRSGDVPLASSDGLIRAELLRVARIRDWQNDPRDRLRLDVELIWEPRLAPLELGLAAGDLRTEDEEGNALRPIHSDATLTQIVSERTGGTQMSWQWSAPPSSARQLHAVTAKVTALLPGTEAQFRFGQLTNAARQPSRRGGVSVSLTDVRQRKGMQEIHILVEYDDDSPAFESHRNWIHRNAAYLQGDDGKIVGHSGLEVWRQQGRSYGLAYQFEVPDLQGMTFVYRTPMTFLSTTVPIEFRDIPLP